MKTITESIRELFSNTRTHASETRRRINHRIRRFIPNDTHVSVRPSVVRPFVVVWRPNSSVFSWWNLKPSGYVDPYQF